MKCKRTSSSKVDAFPAVKVIHSRVTRLRRATLTVPVFEFIAWRPHARYSLMSRTVREPNSNRHSCPALILCKRCRPFQHSKRLGPCPSSNFRTFRQCSAVIECGPPAERRWKSALHHEYECWWFWDRAPVAAARAQIKVMQARRFNSVAVDNRLLD